MIPSTQEIIYRVYGAWVLARFNEGGVQYFDESPRAALRSFFAAVLVAPAYFLGQFLTFSDANVTTDDDPLVVALVFLLDYCLLWTVVPVIVHRICQMIDREKAFFRFLTANNWSSVITLYLQLAIALLASAGILPLAIAQVLGLAAYAYVLGYQWFITRHCLDIPPLGAVGLTALQFLTGLLIESVSVGIVLHPAAPSVSG